MFVWHMSSWLIRIYSPFNGGWLHKMAKGTAHSHKRQTPLTWIECPHKHYAQVACEHQTRPTPNVKLLLLHFCVCNFVVGSIHFCIISISNKKLSKSLLCIFTSRTRPYANTFQYVFCVQTVQCPTFAGWYNVFENFSYRNRKFYVQQK